MWESAGGGVGDLSPNLRKLKMNPFFHSELYLAKVPSGTSYIYIDRSAPQNRDDLEHIVMVSDGFFHQLENAIEIQEIDSKDDLNLA